MRWQASLLLLALGGCGARGYDKVGLATWYGAGLAGRPTASGEPFDPAALTAAHRTLPLGTIARVTAVRTGRSVEVTINDRGPRDHDRLIDLSRGAAEALGTRRDGLARVRVRALGRRELLPRETRTASAAGPWMVQVASLSDRGRAEALAATLGGRAEPAGPLWRVRLGPYASAAAANAARDDLARRGYGDSRTVPVF